MRPILLLLAVFSLLVSAPLAYAECATYTIMTMDGRMQTCTVCCTGSFCTTHCL